MITFICPTCESTLIAKDEKLIGKILTCPKCGSMVLVQSPDEVSTPQYVSPPRPRVHKRFPDILTHETGSGVMSPTSSDSFRSDLLIAEELPETGVTETEVKTRMILVGILFGLLVLLLIALGFLMLLRRPIPQKPLPAPLPPLIRVPVEPQQEPSTEPEPVVDESSVPEKSADEESLPAKSIAQTDPVESLEKPESTAKDSLSSFEQKMPSLLDLSLPNIDIEAKLALPIQELNFEGQRLIDFVRLMSRLTGIPITIHIDDITPIPLTLTAPVTGQFTESTARVVLTDTLASIGLHWIAEDRQISIVCKETKENVELTFDVSDFAEHTEDLNSEVLAEMVQKLVCPDVDIMITENNLLVVERGDANPLLYSKRPKRLRKEILRFLEQLRVIRQMPQKTELTGETLAPEAFGWDQVMKPMTLHYYYPVSLARIIEQLESSTHLMILIDHQSLHQALCAYASIQTAVQCNGGTVNDVLELSLSSIDSIALAYRIVDYQTLEITTAESLRQPDKMTVEVHRYFLQEDETPEDIVRSLSKAVEPNSWFVAEKPETKYGGNVIIDRPSGCLLIRQSQSAQQQIRLYLSTPKS